MKSYIFLVVAILAGFNLKAQDDIPVDKSLIARVYNVADGGYLSRRHLEKAVRLDINEKNSTIISFQFSSAAGDGKLVQIENKGPEFSEQIKTRLRELKIGSKFYIEKIIVENASGTLKARPVTITIKS